MNRRSFLTGLAAIPLCGPLLSRVVAKTTAARPTINRAMPLVFRRESRTFDSRLVCDGSQAFNRYEWNGFAPNTLRIERVNGVRTERNTWITDTYLKEDRNQVTVLMSDGRQRSFQLWRKTDFDLYNFGEQVSA